MGKGLFGRLCIIEICSLRTHGRSTRQVRAAVLWLEDFPRYRQRGWEHGRLKVGGGGDVLPCDDPMEGSFVTLALMSDLRWSLPLVGPDTLSGGAAAVRLDARAEAMDLAIHGSLRVEWSGNDAMHHALTSATLLPAKISHHEDSNK